MKKYDVIIIGCGPGGFTAAEFACKNNLSTLVIEKKDIGGVCLNKGCIPTKALLRVSKMINYLNRANDFGLNNIELKKLKINWNKILSNKDNIIKTLTNGINSMLDNLKLNFIKGNAKVISRNKVNVNGVNYKCKNIILATGSKPRMLNLPGFKEGIKSKKIVSSDQALNFPKIPKTLTIIGGGVIGVEFAITYAGLGTKVIILQCSDKILDMADVDIADGMTNVLRNRGIDIKTNVKIVSYSNEYIIYAINNKNYKIKSDYVLVSIGREVVIDNCGNLNIEMQDRSRIKVNKYMQTSNSNIYAVGDVSAGRKYAHVAYKNAEIAINHIISNKNAINNSYCPSCIYTYPECSSVGMTEKELVDKKIKYYKTTILASQIGKAIADCDSEGFAKILVNKKGKIIGFHSICSVASEIISEVTMVMNLNGTIFDIAYSIHPHPTMSEIVYEVAKKCIFEHFGNK